jgi:hypothetical protein
MQMLWQETYTLFYLFITLLAYLVRDIQYSLHALLAITAVSSENSFKIITGSYEQSVFLLYNTDSSSWK